MEESFTLAQWTEIICQDLDLLARLHDREPEGEWLAWLAQQDFPANLGLRLTAPNAQHASERLRAVLRHLGQVDDAQRQMILDELAADYASIYLTHAYRAAPYESVWLDEENLLYQAPMFAVREWYQRHGLAVQDWRLRSEDHLVPQLQFIAHLLHTPNDRALREAADFIDSHLGLWLDKFTQTAAQRCATVFYANLLELTAEYIRQLRVLLNQATSC